MPVSNDNISISEIASEVTKENRLCCGYAIDNFSLKNVEGYLRNIDDHLSYISNNIKNIDGYRIHIEASSTQDVEKGNYIKEIFEKIKNIKEGYETVEWVFKLPLYLKMFYPLLLYLCKKFPFLLNILM